jgi:3'(2'), 5'-bisphosphate nucleotidase
MFETFREEAGFALRAVRDAARLSQRIQGEMITPALSKSDRSPVTVADYASQALVARLLQEFDPEATLVAEEDARALRQDEHSQTLASVTSYVRQPFPRADEEQVITWIDRGAGTTEGRFWTLDPVDGTKGFLRGDQYVVALALVVRGQVVLGALGCPNLNRDLQPDPSGQGCALVAVKEAGAWVTGLGGGELDRLQVSGRDDPARARILMSYEASHTDTEKMAQLTQALGARHEPVRMDSQAKFAVMAGGGGEVLFRLLSPEKPDYREKIWDQAAGSCIIREAGGRVTDLRGRDLDFSRGRLLSGNFGVLVSNGRLHEAALGAVQAVGADQRPGRV